MSSSKRWIGRLFFGVAVVASTASLAPVSSAGCTGPMTIYYETSAMLDETGAKLVCPTGTYYDEGPNGSYQETPYFVTQTMSCPCTGGGPVGGGGGEEEEEI